MKYNFGRVLKTTRKLRKLTQKQLSEKLHVEASTISKIECGYSSPSIDTLRQLALALRVSADTLLEIEKTTNSDTNKPSPKTIAQIAETRNSLDDLLNHLSVQENNSEYKK